MQFRRKVMLKILCIAFLCFKGKNVYAQKLYDIIITEVFADPTPSHGLPEKEFIEIYNNTPEEIDLKGLILFYANSEVDLPAYILPPHQYLILCRYNNAELFEPYGEVLGLEKFSLLNEGTTLRLENAEGRLVYQLTYSSNWYADGRDQGYSLEMIDINYPCKTMGNWISSSAEIGASPGAVNASSAVIHDIDGPKYLNYTSDDNRLFLLYFDEEIDLNISALEIQVVNGNVQLDSIFVNPGQENVLVLVYHRSLSDQELVQTRISGLSDCIGNLSGLIKIQTGSVKQPGPGSLLLTEVLFNPYNDGADFIEFVNVGSDVLDLANIQLELLFAGEVQNGPFERGQTVAPGQVICITEDKKAQLRAYTEAREENILEVEHLPAYPNAMGNVVLVNGAGEVVDEVEYSEALFPPEIENPDGVSLSRVSLQVSGLDPSNWVPTYTLFGYATPGIHKPQENKGGGFGVQPETYAFSPDGDGIEDFVTIRYRSGEPSILNSYIYDISGNLIFKVAENQWMHSQVSYSWNGDEFGHTLLKSGYYIVYASFRTKSRIVEKNAKILLIRP